MSRTHRSLTKLTLPPELAANITSFGCLFVFLKPGYVLILAIIPVNKSASSATFVGGGSTSASRGFQVTFLCGPPSIAA